MFSWEITTPAGTRVDPEVYCKYAVLVSAGSDDSSRGESRSSESTAMTTGAAWFPWLLAYGETASTAAVVVRITVGAQSVSTDEIRSSWTPYAGIESGTAMKPAWTAPRKDTMYSRPCAATMAT